MKAKLKIAAAFCLLVSSTGFATMNKSTDSLAAPGSTQFVTVMNNLANPVAPNHTKSTIMVKYYDGTGTHPACWVEYKIEYRSDPNVGGAGGRNACGVNGTTPAAIVKIDILPQKTATGVKMYEDLTDISIDPNKFYNNVMVEQDRAPEFYPDGSMKALGTVKITKFVETR